MIDSKPSIAWKITIPHGSIGASSEFELRADAIEQGKLEALRVMAEVLVQVASELTLIRGALENNRQTHLDDDAARGAFEANHKDWKPLPPLLDEHGHALRDGVGYLYCTGCNNFSMFEDAVDHLTTEVHLAGVQHRAES